MRKIIVLFFAIIFITSGCSQKKIDPSKLCREFYQLNKNKTFDCLYDVYIGGRVISIYDKSSNQYEEFPKRIEVYDFKSKEYIIIPIYKKGATLIEKDSIYKEYDPKIYTFLADKLKITSQKELFEAYIKYVDSVLSKYYDIETPKWYSNKRVIIDGTPQFGKFLTFTLNTSTNKCKVYYLADRTSLSPYWIRHFDKIQKLDSNWYYEIMPITE